MCFAFLPGREEASRRRERPDAIPKPFFVLCYWAG